MHPRAQVLVTDPCTGEGVEAPGKVWKHPGRCGSTLFPGSLDLLSPLPPLPSGLPICCPRAYPPSPLWTAHLLSTGLSPLTSQDCPFVVRGPTYLKDKKKVPAGMAAFTFGAMDMVSVPGAVEHVARFLPSIR